MNQKFCFGEGEAFDATEFVRWTNSVEIHVLTETDGHTTDGFAATFQASKGSDGGWTVSDVVVDVADVAIAEEEE
jgi:hypothetical protein